MSKKSHSPSSDNSPEPQAAGAPEASLSDVAPLPDVPQDEPTGTNVLRSMLENLAPDITPQAIRDSQTTSLGALEAQTSLTGFGKAAEAWAPHKPELSAVHDALSLNGSTHILGGLANESSAMMAGRKACDAELLAMAAQACGDPQMRDEAERVRREAKLLSRRQYGGEPTKIKMGQRTLAIPASVTQAPAVLHAERPDLADQLFSMFCKGKMNMVMENASKTGHSLTPFCFLAQHTYHLLDREHKNFQPYPRLEKNEKGEAVRCKNKRGEVLDPPFDPDDAREGDCVRLALEAWAGRELAFLILQRCYAGNISLLAGLRACYKKLDDNRKAELSNAQIFATARQWVKEEDDDD